MKNILIVFPDRHLPYAPTILNLYYGLKPLCNVSLISSEPDPSFSSLKIVDPGIIYFSDETFPKAPGIISRAFNKLKQKIIVPSTEEITQRKLLIPKAKKIIELIKESICDEIIAVDFFALWCVQQTGKKAHLISLEILEKDEYRDTCNLSIINSVLIQTEERYNYLFDNKLVPKYIVQNAPKYIEFLPSYESRESKHLIYCGSAVPWFGIFSCLDFLNDYPDYKLTIKGAIPPNTLSSINIFYKNLLDEGRVILDDLYLDTEALTKYVSKFRIGFAFYDFYRYDHMRIFNYFTAPSGKVFQYFNSGVPVIGNQLKGFKIIEENNAGVLIPTLSSRAIKKSIDVIENNYTEMARNAKMASDKFDFNNNIKPFIKNLI